MSARLLWTLFWLMVALAASAGLILEWRHPPRLPGRPAAAPATVTVPLRESFRPPAAARYAEINARPLFVEARRPEQDVPLLPPPAPESVERPLDLIGVVLLPGRAAALLRPQDPKEKVVRIRQGEQIDGWRLDAVRADRVVLRKGDQVRELPLLRPSATPKKPGSATTGGMPPPNPAALPSALPIPR